MHVCTHDFQQILRKCALSDTEVSTASYTYNCRLSQTRTCANGLQISFLTWSRFYTCFVQIPASLIHITDFKIGVSAQVENPNPGPHQGCLQLYANVMPRVNAGSKTFKCELSSVFNLGSTTPQPQDLSGLKKDLRVIS